MRTSILFIFLIVALSGCHNHPLQDDVTGYDTSDIIRRIRCEAKEQILRELTDRGFNDHQRRVLQLKRRISNFEEFAASNRSELKKIDKVISDNDVKGEALAAERKSLEQAYKKVQGEADALDKLIQSQLIDEAKDPGAVAALRSRHKTVFARGYVIRERIASLDQDIENAKKERKGDIIKHDALLRKILPGLTEAEYLKAKEHHQSLQKEYGAADLDLKARRELFQINNTTLALKLDFKVTESNDASAGGSVTWPIHLGSFSLIYGAGREKERVAQRIVDTVSLFEEVTNKDRLDCSRSPVTPGRRARTYPITGNIGVGDYVNQYFRIREETTIATGKDTFTDTLTFTTKVGGQLNPTIEIRPVSPSILKAGIDLKAERIDLHVVTLQIRPYSPPASEGRDPRLEVTKVPEVRVRISDDIGGIPPRIAIDE